MTIKSPKRCQFIMTLVTIIRRLDCRLMITDDANSVASYTNKISNPRCMPVVFLRRQQLYEVILQVVLVSHYSFFIAADQHNNKRTQRKGARYTKYNYS